MIPPPIPSEYLLPLYGIVATSLVGWSIPSISGWFKARKQAKVMSGHHRTIKTLYNDNRVDEKDIPDLDNLKNVVDNDYSKVRISDEQYKNIKSDITEFTGMYTIRR